MVGRGDASSGRTGVVAGGCWQDVTSPVHGHIVDHDLLGYGWFVSYWGVMSSFQTVVGMGDACSLFFIHLMPVLETVFVPLFSLLFLLLSCCSTYLSYHITCCISLHILYPVICLIDNKLLR